MFPQNARDRDRCGNANVASAIFEVGVAGGETQEMEKLMKCQTCGTEIEKPATGRPKRYCSTACRRVAEFEIRRLNKRIGRLEERFDDESEQVDAPTPWDDVYGRNPAARLAAVEKLIRRAETRLKTLLTAAED